MLVGASVVLTDRVNVFPAKLLVSKKQRVLRADSLMHTC